MTTHNETCDERKKTCQQYYQLLKYISQSYRLPPYRISYNDIIATVSRKQLPYYSKKPNAEYVYNNNVAPLEIGLEAHYNRIGRRDCETN